mgnify:CR=1 FL=1
MVCIEVEAMHNCAWFIQAFLTQNTCDRSSGANFYFGIIVEEKSVLVQYAIHRYVSSMKFTPV